MAMTTGEGFTVLPFEMYVWLVDRSQKVTTKGHLFGSVLKSVWIGASHLIMRVTYTIGMIAYHSGTMQG
jgi:hypothetical protein